ncbi:MAG: histidine phosphatase family protein [Ilumatobacteraceae bacterium]
MSSPGRLLVLRHGQSEWNAARRWQGQADIDLTETGRAQARTAAERLANGFAAGFSAVISSDLTRARDTATIIASVTGLELLAADPRLRETHVGEWQGLTHDEIERDWPGYLDTHRRPPGFESEDSILERVTASFADLSARFADGNILVVSHAGIVRVLRRRLGAPDERIANLGGSWFTVWPDRIQPGDLVDMTEHDEVGEEL